MTTFTITCPPTVAGTTLSTSATGSGNWAASLSVSDEFATALIGSVVGEGADSFALISQTDSDSNVATISQESNSYTIGYSTLDGDVADDYPSQSTAEATQISSFSWDGGRTVQVTSREIRSLGDFSPPAGETITGTTWTAAVSTSSQTTTTETESVFQTTFTTETQVTTRTGTLVQTGTMTAPEPSTTQTLVPATTSSQSNYTTTRIRTTTQQDNYSVWRSATGAASHRGTFQSATVVCLDTSEVAYVVTSRPAYTTTLTAAASFPTATQFTVLPSFVATAGAVIDATDNTSSEELQTATTYKTTSQTATTLTVGTENFFGGSSAQLPVLTRTLAATTRTIQDYFSTIRESSYTGGDISTTTRQTTTTHQGRIGTLTWNATHTESATAQTTFPFSTSKTESAEFGGIYPQRFEEEFDDLTDETDVQLSDIKTENGQRDFTTAVTFNRAISQVAGPLTIAATQNQAGSSLSHAFAAASALTAPAQIVGAEGVTAKRPIYTFAARTARAPLGAWSYLDGTSSVSASADAAGLSVTTTSGPTTSLITESTSGSWTVGGAAVSRADVGAGMAINMGGVPATGDSLTALYAGGIFSTTNSAGSGTIEASEASTALVGSANRTAYLPASGVFVTGGARYGTSKRNITDTIAETALITNRSQLVL
jgi:hypothetical protein